MPKLSTPVEKLADDVLRRVQQKGDLLEPALSLRQRLGEVARV